MALVSASISSSLNFIPFSLMQAGGRNKSISQRDDDMRLELLAHLSMFVLFFKYKRWLGNILGKYIRQKTSGPTNKYTVRYCTMYRYQVNSYYNWKNEFFLQNKLKKSPQTTVPICVFRAVLWIQIHWIWIRIQDFGPIWIQIQIQGNFERKNLK